MHRRLLVIVGMGVLLAACIGCAASAVPAAPSTAFTIMAKDYVYTPDTMEVPANARLDVTLDNQDGSIPHGLDVWPAGPYTNQDPLFEGEVIYGVAQKTYAVPALRPGLYLFGCPRHDDERVLVTVRE
jgi:hypothetical protein